MGLREALRGSCGGGVTACAEGSNGGLVGGYWE